MAPPEQTLHIPRSALFQDLVGVVEPIGHVSPGSGAVRLESVGSELGRPLSPRIRSGEDRRGRGRAGERRSGRSGRSGGADASLHRLGYPGLGQDIRDDVFQDGFLSWFEDLRWGTPLARKLIGVAAAIAFLAFCVFVMMVTFGGQAVL